MTMSNRVFTYLFCSLGLILIVCLLFTGNLNRIRMQPHSFSGQDEEHHLLRGLLVHDNLWKSEGKLFSNSDVAWPSRWPPLLYFSSAITMKLFGRSQQVMAMSGTLFFILLIVAVFGIGTKLHSPWAGLAAAALTATWPYLFRYSKYYNLDIPLTACFAGTAFFLLASDGFTRRWPSVGLGACFGLGMLSKIVFPFFAAPFVAAEIWIQREKGKTLLGKNFFIAMAIAGLIGAFWYLPKLGQIFDELYFHIAHYNREFGTLQAETGEFFLAQGLRELGPLSWLVILIAVFQFPVKHRRRLAPLYVWLILPLLLSSLAPSDIARFAMASLPAAALLVVLAAFSSRKHLKWINILLLAAFVGVNLSNCWKLSTAPEEWLFSNLKSGVAQERSSWNIAEEITRRLPQGSKVDVCYFQDFGPEKLSGEHMWFMMAMKDGRVLFNVYDLYNGRWRNYKSLLGCLEKPGIVIFWTNEKDAAWPDKDSVLKVVLLTHLHSVDRAERLVLLGFPREYDFNDFPSAPPDNLELVYENSIEFYSAGTRYNRIYVYGPPASKKTVQ